MALLTSAIPGRPGAANAGIRRLRLGS